MDIRDFILTEEPDTVETAARPKKKPSIAYNILASNEMDFVIEKRGKRSQAIMAIIPSKEQYYINNIVKEKGEEKAVALNFNAENIKWFLSGLEAPFSLPVEWCSYLEKGAEFARNFADFIDCNAGIIKLGIAEFGYAVNQDLIYVHEISPNLSKYLVKVKKTVPQTSPIVERYSTYQPFSCGSFDEGYFGVAYLAVMEQIFGLDATRNYVEAFVERDLNFGCPIREFALLINDFYTAHGYDEPLTDSRRGLDYAHPRYTYKEPVSGNNAVRIDLRAFTEYALTYQKEGFDCLRSFFRELGDDWRMQGLLSNTIRVKYPKYLSTHHDQLALKYRFISNEVNKEKFAEYYDAVKHLEWQGKEYVIKVPETVEDIVDEAIQQNNCLQSYISRVLDRQTTIVFLRKKKCPEKSLVTIEVQNNSVIQAKAHFNKTPGNSEMVAIKEWADKKKIYA